MMIRRLSSPLRYKTASLADCFGATASFLCAIHCALLPAVIAVLPALGLSFLADHGFERGFVALAAMLAIGTLISGFRRHQRFYAFGFFLPGIALLSIGLLMDFEHREMLHGVLVSFGGTLVAAAHLTNLRLGNNHIHGPACEL